MREGFMSAPFPAFSSGGYSQMRTQRVAYDPLARAVLIAYSVPASPRRRRPSGGACSQPGRRQSIRRQATLLAELPRRRVAPRAFAPAQRPPRLLCFPFARGARCRRISSSPRNLVARVRARAEPRCGARLNGWPAVYLNWVVAARKTRGRFPPGPPLSAAEERDHMNLVGRG